MDIFGAHPSGEIGTICESRIIGLIYSDILAVIQEEWHSTIKKKNCTYIYVRLLLSTYYYETYS